MMTIKDLSIGYDDHPMQEGLNAHLVKGRLTCLIGRNGVGKSTLIRTLTGFQKPCGGSVAIAGEDVSTLSRQEFSKNVSIVLTARPEVEHMTVAEVVGLGRSPYTGIWGSLTANDHEIVAGSLAAVGVTHLSERRLHTLSDGECQKVMIAKALAQDTPIIILDEPTAFLDYPSKAEMMSLLRSIAHEGKAILLSTHDLEIAFSIADTLWLMRQNGLTEGTARDFLGDKQSFTPEDICRIF